MATWMFIDSNARLNGEVTDFVIESEQTNAWSQFQRTDGNQSCCTAGAACILNASITNLLIHYDTTTAYNPVPLVKIHLFNIETRDLRLVNSMTPVEFTFIGQLNPYLSGSLNTPQPGWASYTCPMIQRMRMRRNGTFVFKVMDAQTDLPLTALRVQCMVSLI